MFDRQLAFETAVKGIWSQQAFSVVPATVLGVSCQYRGPKGTKCAVGWMIPDSEYVPELENRVADDEQVTSAVDPKFGDIDASEFDFLIQMQRKIHDMLVDDGFQPDKFKEAVTKFAELWELKVDDNLFN